jgi:hypothetical protein
MAYKLDRNERLNVNDSLTSDDGRFTLILQGDGNLVLYQDGRGALWSTQTDGRAVEYVVMQGDGNFVLYGTGGDAIWASGTNGNPGSYLVVQSENKAVWATYTMVATSDATQADKTAGGSAALLFSDTSEYGWHHKGVRSWGSNWGTRAVNEALEQIRTRIASMVNLKELEVELKKSGSKGFDLSGGSTKKGDLNGKIALSSSKSSEQRTIWVNENNYLVDVNNVRIKPGTEWTKTEKSLDGKRRWEASATMLYDVEIYGLEPQTV